VEKIYQHIEKLLAKHDYVVVPNLGGFVVQTQSAKLLIDRITPPLSTVGFNPLMHYSDGLLAIEIARNEGISYREASEFIDKEIEKLKSKIGQSKKIEFGNLGFFEQNQGEGILFSPKSSSDFLPLNIGISEIYYTEVTNKKTKDPKTITLKLPSKQTFRYGAAAVLVFGLLFVSPRVNDMHKSNQADFSTLLPIVLPENMPVIDSTAINMDSLSAENLTPYDSVKFHVVVASLPTQLSAENYCKTLEKENFVHAHVLPPAKKYRVAIKSFSNRETAIEFMENLRLSSSQFVTAWVLCDK